MANAFEQAIKKAVRTVIRMEYPQCSRPMAVRARITKVQPLGYSLVVLDEELNRNQQYPEIPGVISSGNYLKGDVVVITFINGQDAYIIGSG